MRAGKTQWRQWQQLGLAVRASHLPSATTPEASSLMRWTFSLWSNFANQPEKSQNLTSLQGPLVHDSNASYGERFPDSQRGFRNFLLQALKQDLGGRGGSSVSMSNSGRLCFPTCNHVPWLRTQVSNASSQAPDYWDPVDSNPPTPSKLVQEEAGLDQDGDQRGWDHDFEGGQDLGHMQGSRQDSPEHWMKTGDKEGIDWGQKHVRIREYETRHHPNVVPILPPKYQPSDVYIPVKACYVSRSVDLKRLSEEPFVEVIVSRNNLIIRFANRAADAPPTSNRPGLAEISRAQERYMVAFQYGSVVFFNFDDEEEEEALCAVRKFCTDEFRETRKDDYGVLVRPALPEWSEGGQDQIMLRMLDTDNIRVISSILGQSIALDHYAKKVDEMVNTFSELNRGMEKTGTFTMTRKSLFQLVAAANTTLADVILRLGLLERSDTAWKDANYAQIWEYLRDDFELDERFESLDFKLNIIQHNVRFFLEILQNRKSDTLEWIIILLITGEICVSLYEILHTAHAI